MISFGLSKCAIAKKTVANDVISYAAPVKVPGAVEMKATPKGDIKVYEADNVDYVTVDQSEGYEVEAKFYDMPVAVVKEYFGIQEDTNKVAGEFAGATFPSFAFLGQIDGDAHNRRFAYMDCQMTKRISVETKTARGKEPNTVTVTFAAKPRATDNLVMLYTKPDTDATAYAAWFTEVPEFTPGA